MKKLILAGLLVLATVGTGKAQITSWESFGKHIGQSYSTSTETLDYRLKGDYEFDASTWTYSDSWSPKVVIYGTGTVKAIDFIGNLTGTAAYAESIDDSNYAKLDGTQTFTGENTFDGDLKITTPYQALQSHSITIEGESEPFAEIQGFSITSKEDGVVFGAGDTPLLMAIEGRDGSDLGLNMLNHRILRLADPTSDTNAVNKRYVDSAFVSTTTAYNYEITASTATYAENSGKLDGYDSTHFLSTPTASDTYQVGSERIRLDSCYFVFGATATATTKAVRLTPFREYETTISTITAQVVGGTSVTGMIEIRPESDLTTAGTDIWTGDVTAVEGTWTGGTESSFTIPADNALYFVPTTWDGAVDKVEFKGYLLK